MSTPRVHYLIQRRHDVPAGDGWLTAAESRVLNELNVDKRREDWRLGRWTAKQALRRLLPDSGRTVREWGIQADATGAPVATLADRPVAVAISISHSGDHGLCALAEQSLAIGCDLERIEPRTRAFEDTWFTDPEIGLLDLAPREDRARMVTLIWSAKESALKLLKTGLRADTRRVRVRWRGDPGTARWRAFAVEDSLDERVFHGWWRQQDRMMVTVTADRPVAPPSSLDR